MRYFVNFFSFKSIQTKMMVVFIIMVVLPMLLITYFSIKGSERFLQQKISQSDYQVLEQMSNSINSSLQAMINASSLFTQDRQLVDLLSMSNNLDSNQIFNKTQLFDKEMQKAKNSILLNFNSYISIFDFNGNLYTSGSRQATDNFEKYSSTQWFKDTLAANGFMLWIAPQSDYIKTEDLSSGPVITLSRLIKGSRSLGGYGIVTISISESEFFRKIFKNTAGDVDNNVFIIDDKGVVISSGQKEIIGKTLSEEFHINKISDNSKNNYITKIEGKKTIISYASIELTKWKLVKMNSYDILFMDLIKDRNKNLILISLMSLIFLGVTTLIVYGITKPIKTLKETMKLVEDGDLNIRANIKGHDEVSQLGTSFNSMLSYIKELIENIRDKQKKEEELKLEVLQAQINPHFLFNTLNTIKWTAVINQANNVASLIEALGRILEMSVKDMNKLITIKDEVENLNSYLMLQKARYNQRFTESISIAEDIMNLKIPRLILQPIVENSIVHGLKEDKVGDLKIIITGEIREGMLLLNVEDDGAGIEKERLDEIYEDYKNKISRNRFGRIGLQNVHRRIELLFGAPYGIKINSKLHIGTNIEILLPVIEEEMA